MALPSRGSLQDRILKEAVERERYAEYRKTIFLGRMTLLAIRGSNLNTVESLEEELALAIFQTAFDPRQIEEQMARLKAVMQEQREAQLRDARMMRKVASYSDDEQTADQTAHEDVFNRRINQAKDK